MPDTRGGDVEKVRLTARGRAALVRADPVFGRAMDRIGPYRLEITPLHSVYEALARSIVYQQLTGKAAGTIWQRLLTLGGGANPPASHTIPQLDDEALRGVGLSRNKVLALRDLAARDVAGELPDAATAAILDDETLIERLSAVRGIGTWSVQMLLIFRLGRPDVMPSADLGVQKGFQRAFGLKSLPTPAQVEARATRWAPSRTMASWYLWRLSELKD